MRREAELLDALDGVFNLSSVASGRITTIMTAPAGRREGVWLVYALRESRRMNN